MKLSKEFVVFASYWYSGSGSMLYAVASTGGLTRGTIRPYYNGQPLSDAEWDFYLWDSLRVELEVIKPHIQTFDDAATFADFLKFVDGVCNSLPRDDD